MLDFNFFLTLSIFVLGSITVFLSLVVSAKFIQYRKNLQGKPRKLADAVAWQLAGEAVMGIGTLIFSVAAFMGILSNIETSIQSMIRFIMFFATGFTTIHLHRTLKNMGD